MENRLQATFMPKQAAVPGSGAYARAKNPTNFLMLIGSLLFILAIGAFGGLYVYKGYLKSSNEEKKAQVEDTIKNFDPELNKELSLLKARIDAAKQLVASHHAFSLLFALMELNTAQTVRFTDFSYNVGVDKKINLAMKGEARSYTAVAFQSDVFSKLTPLKSPVVSGLSLQESGNIAFDVAAELDPASVSYRKLVEGFTQQAAAASAQNTGTTTPGVTPGNTGTSTSTSTPR